MSVFENGMFLFVKDVFLFGHDRFLFENDMILFESDLVLFVGDLFLFGSRKSDQQNGNRNAPRGGRGGGVNPQYGGRPCLGTIGFCLKMI